MEDLRSGRVSAIPGEEVFAKMKSPQFLNEPMDTDKIYMTPDSSLRKRAREIFPSSYVCTCGVESHHCENTIREMKQMSLKKRAVLVADDGEHEIIFHQEEFVAMWCPKQQKEIPAK